jgi:nitroreductase
MQTTPTPEQDFAGLAAQRRSCRDYDPQRPVDDADLIYCLEAARLAPSACNRQPWRFVVVRDPDLRARIRDQALQPGLRMEWLGNAPVLVVLCAEAEWTTHRAAPLLTRIPYEFIDAAIAGEHFVLAAAERGLGTCWIGWIRPRRLRRLLGIPRGVRIVSLLSVGYPASPPTPPRPRKDLEAIVHWEKWTRATE